MRAGPRGVAHDEDGNLVEDGDFFYGWDAENRLVSVTPVSPGIRQRRLEFEYDYMSRRIRKLVFGWNSTTEDWEVDPEVDLRFVYEGWNLVQEIDGLVTVTSGVTDVAREYTWGLDLSGQSGNVAPANGRLSGIHGAGGIGGLLGTHWTLNTTSTSDDKAYIYFYDANGNVGQMIDVVSGTNYSTIAAKYEYYPFGGLLVAAGVAAEANPFRFSTKYRDNETGCYYYGYRYLRTKHGRWLNRDPIGEFGGINIYVSIDNNPVLKIDKLGLCCPGEITNVRCEFRIHSIISSPEIEDRQDALLSALGDIQTLAEMIELLKSTSGRRFPGFDKSEQEITDWLIEQGAHLNYYKLKERLKDKTDYENIGRAFRDAYEANSGHSMGYNIYTRMSWDECKWGWVWNEKEHRQSDWLKYDKRGYIRNDGHIPDRITAYQLAVEVCEERKDTFEYVYKSVIK